MKRMTDLIKKKEAKLLILGLTFFVLVSILGLSMESCPEKMQAVLVLKIIPFVKNYNTEAPNFELNIGIYGNSEILQFFQWGSKKLPYKVNYVPISETDPKLDNIQIVYISGGTSPASIEKLLGQSKKNKILSVCGDPNITLEKNITLSFYVKNENPKIMINWKSSKEEGISFSSNLLSLADVRNSDK